MRVYDVSRTGLTYSLQPVRQTDDEFNTNASECVHMRDDTITHN